MDGKVSKLSEEEVTFDAGNLWRFLQLCIDMQCFTPDIIILSVWWV